MVFFRKNKFTINTIHSIAIIADVVVAFLINYFSQENFELFSSKNIVLMIIFGLLIVTLIICNILGRDGSSKRKSKRFQKAFQECGCYEVLMDEMKESIKNHDLKSAKKLKKIADLIEK